MIYEIVTVLVVAWATAATFLYWDAWRQVNLQTAELTRVRGRLSETAEELDAADDALDLLNKQVAELRQKQVDAEMQAALAAQAVTRLPIPAGGRKKSGKNVRGRPLAANKKKQKKAKANG